AVKRGQDPVAGGGRLSSAVTVELSAGRRGLLGEQVAPGGVAQAHCRCRRVNDVSAHDRGQYALATADQRARERAHAGEVVDNAWLVPQHPRIMTRLNFEDHARPDLHLESIWGLKAHPAG